MGFGQARTGQATRAIWLRLGLFALALALSVAFAPGPNAGAQQGKDFLVGPEQLLVRSLQPPAAAPAPGRTSVPRSLPQGPISTAPATVPAANTVDSATPTAQSASTAPTVLSNRFEGIDDGDDVVLAGFALTPPDPQVAVGPNHVFEMANVIGRIYDKKGNTLQTFLLDTFFNVPVGWFGTDPRLLYDASSSHWFAVFVSFKDNGGNATDFGRLHVAVSQTDDPTGAWNRYYAPYTNVLPDYPGLGITDDKLTVSGNIFDIDNQNVAAGCDIFYGYCGEETTVIQKSDLVAGGTAAKFAFPWNADRFTVRPAQSLSSISDQYLATVDFTLSTRLTLIRVTGTPAAANVAEASAVNLTILPQDSPPLSVTSGGQIDSGDFRLLDATWRDGTLWASASAACTPAGDTTSRSCAHLIAVNTAGPTVVQDMMFGAAGQYYSWPAVRTDASGNLFVSLTHTNSTIFAEAAVAGRQVTDPLNTLGGVSLVRKGDVVHTSSRWGDYLGAAADPSDPACVWVIGEYAKDTPGPDWGTYIAGAYLDGSCDRDSDGWSNSGDNCPDWGNQAQALPPWLVPPGDPDCDGSSTANELRLGTNSAAHCAATAAADDEPPPDAWPVDFNNDQRITISDVLKFIVVFNTSPGDPADDIRFDLSGDNKITLQDVLMFIPFFSQGCAASQAPTATPSPSATPHATPTPSPAPTLTPTPTAAPLSTPTPTPTPTR